MQTHTKNDLAHRHFIALPVVLVFCGMFVSLQSDLKAASLLHFLTKPQELSTKAEPMQLTLSDQLTITLGAHSALIEHSETEIELLQGSAHVTAQRFAKITTSQEDIYVIGGSIFLVKQNGTLTIAALNAPVFIAEGKVQRLLATGYQLSIDSGATLRTSVLSALPLPWLADQKESISKVQASAFDLIDSEESALNALIALPLAEQSQEQSQLFLSSVRSLSTEKNIDVFASVRLLGYMQEPAGNDVLVAALAGSSVDAHSFAHGLLVMTKNGQILPDLALKHMGELTKRAAVSNPLLAGKDLLSLIDAIIVQYEVKGFPLYVGSMKEIRKQFLALLKPLLTADQMKRLTSKEIENNTAETSDVSENPILVEAAKELFVKYGMDFTVESECMEVADWSVRCTGLFFSGKTDEHLIDFTITAPSGKVSDIVLDGQLQPNALPLDVFLNTL